MKVNEPAIVIFCIFNPLTAPACKISGLKSAHIHARKQYICWSCDRSTFNTMHLGGSPFRCSRNRRRKSLNDFKFGTFIARFPSDSAARMSVKGLKGNHLTFVGPQHRGVVISASAVSQCVSVISGAGGGRKEVGGL